jgi:type IV secretory pathway protease TraF
MLPAYRDGDFVLVCKIPFLFDKLRRGDVIAFRHKEYGTMIKKVQNFTPANGEVVVTGTQEDSVDSRRFGPITYEDVLGKVIWHIKKP